MFTLNVENMTCGHCVRAITQAITDLDPKAEVTVDLETKQVDVESTLELNKILLVLDEEGFSAQVKL